MKPKVIKLTPSERIVAVVPEYCKGSGWRNAPVLVYIATYNNTLRLECIQPDEQTPEMKALFHAGEAMCVALIGAVPQSRVKSSNDRLTRTEKQKVCQKRSLSTSRKNDQTTRIKMVRINGKSFRCRCGRNVFTEYAPYHYRCGCGLEYAGDSVSNKQNKGKQSDGQTQN